MIATRSPKGFAERQPVTPFRVSLTYFKPNGSYYSDGEYISTARSALVVWDEVANMRRDGKLPGLVRGSGKSFIILVVTSFYSVPMLLMPSSTNEGGTV